MFDKTTSLENILEFVHKDLEIVKEWESKHRNPSEYEVAVFAHEYASMMYKLISEYPGGGKDLRRDMFIFATHMKMIVPILIEFINAPWPFSFVTETPVLIPEDIDILAVLRGHRV